MAIKIKVNGTERQDVVLWGSLNWQQNQTSRPDTVTFTLRKTDSRVFSPDGLDVIELYEDSTLLFGGQILSIALSTKSVDLHTYTVTAKDRTHEMDGLLIVERYTGKPLVNIIADITNRYLNKGKRVEIATFEVSEIWSGGTVDTDNYRVGDRSRKLTSINTVADSMNRYILVNIDPDGYDDNDFIEIDVYVDNIANLDTCTLVLGDEDLTNHYSYECAGGLATGWTHLRVARGDFTLTGTFDWADVEKVSIEIVSVSSETVNVSFDNWQFRLAESFSWDNSIEAMQVVPDIVLNYEYPSKAFQKLAELYGWNWFVDENRDIHFFAKYDKNAPFTLTDTSGNYKYESLVVKETYDQIRNSIFVRGADYLAGQITEDLQHQADGQNKIFKLGYKYAEYTLEVNSVAVPVGVDNLQEFADNNGASNPRVGGTPVALGDNSAREKVSQQVITTISGRRKKVILRLKKVGTPADNIQVQIFTDDGSNAPDGTNLSDVQVVAGGTITTDFANYTFTFGEASAGDLNLDSQVYYHIVISRSGAIDASNYYLVEAVGVGAYEGLSYTYNGSVWTENLATLHFYELVDYDVLYSYQEKNLTFAVAPADTDTIEWTAKPYLPIIKQYVDIGSINEYGERQILIKDFSIKSAEQARQRAKEEILSYKDGLCDVSFETNSEGLEVGQTISVSSAKRGLSLDLIINKITVKAKGPDTFKYSVSAVLTKTMGIIYWMQKQIENDGVSTPIVEDELLDKTTVLLETLVFDAEYAVTLYQGKFWSNDAETTTDRLIWNGGLDHIWI